jgi:hypothetical protein
MAGPIAAQGRHGPRGEVYGAPIQRPYQVPPPPRMRARKVDPYYGNTPTIRRYGHGTGQHWSRRRQPAWREGSATGGDGWGRPRYFDYR